MPEGTYLDSALYVSSLDSARFSWSGREYLGKIALDDDRAETLAALELEPEAYGSELYDAVFPAGSELREGLREAVVAAEQEKSRLRFLLHLAPDLPEWVHGLFWELLTDSGRHLSLARSPDTAFSRYMGVRRAPGTPATRRPRLLCVIAAPSNIEKFNLAEIRRDEVVQRLEAPFGMLAEFVDVAILEPPATLGRLRAPDGGRRLPPPSLLRPRPEPGRRLRPGDGGRPGTSSVRRRRAAGRGLPGGPRAAARHPHRLPRRGAVLPRPLQRPRRPARPARPAGRRRHAPGRQRGRRPPLHQSPLWPPRPDRPGRRGRQRGAAAALSRQPPGDRLEQPRPVLPPHRRPALAPSGRGSREGGSRRREALIPDFLAPPAEPLALAAGPRLPGASGPRRLAGSESRGTFRPLGFPNLFPTRQERHRRRALAPPGDRRHAARRPAPADSSGNCRTGTREQWRNERFPPPARQGFYHSPHPQHAPPAGGRPSRPGAPGRGGRRRRRSLPPVLRRLGPGAAGDLRGRRRAETP